MADQSLIECNVCGGRYPDVQRDGTQYFHACPKSRAVDAGPNPKFVDAATTPDVPERLTKREPIVGAVDENTVADLVTHRKANTTVITDAAVVAAFFTPQEVA
jgi:hypothetical protein